MTGTRVDLLISELTLEEKCLLTAGRDMWSTQPISRVGLPLVRLTDGPNGARGPVRAGEGTHTSACVPCGTALAATWDLPLLSEVGALVAEESVTKGCSVLLAPTVNIHRSPLAGRNFECFSEDPLLSGLAAAAFVRGAQDNGVVCTVKHFVGNEAEHERQTMSSEIDERTLREIYLRPFEIAVRDGGALGIMTGYNRLNGTWCAEHPLLRDVVREEWGFEGFVVSDWGGIGSSEGSLHAGLDLEMPGPGNYYGQHLLEGVRRGDVDEAEVDRALRRVLTALERVGALDAEPADPHSLDRPEHRDLARRAATSSFVLLRNDGLLPLDADRSTKIAVIGPFAEQATYTGGGASNFKPHRRPSPLEALRRRLPASSVTFEPGCSSHGQLPVLPVSLEVAVLDDAAPGTPVQELVTPDAQLIFPEGVPDAGPSSYRLRAAGDLVITEAGTYTFSLVQLSRTIVSIDGEVVIDGIANTGAPGRFPWSPQPLLGEVELRLGTHRVTVEAVPDAGSPYRYAGFTIGMRRAVLPDAMERAVHAAAEADVVVVLVGSDSQWETEAVDRPHMALRGQQDELVSRVAAANPRTVVVVNTGSPVTMPWAEEAGAVLQSWFGGQEMDEALVDVLLGEAEPGGRLPTSFPVRLEHTPSFGTFPGESGDHRYAEGVFVGYRWYDARALPVQFPFGHGLGYATFTLSDLTLSCTEVVDGDGLLVDVEVTVTNVGDRSGSEVVQCYVGPVECPTTRPVRELRAFAKVHLDPGATTRVTLQLDRRAFARWQPTTHHPVTEPQLRLVADHAALGPDAGSWVVDPGTYHVLVGRSSADLPHRAELLVRPAAEASGTDPNGDNAAMHLG